MSVNIKVTGGSNIEWGQIDPKVTGGLNIEWGQFDPKVTGGLMNSEVLVRHERSSTAMDRERFPSQAHS